jgi:hypothetical protein
MSMYRQYDEFRVPAPNPRDIRHACREIQRGWSDKMRRRREAYRIHQLIAEPITFGVLQGRGEYRP